MNELAIRIYWGPDGGQFQSEPLVQAGDMAVEFEPKAPLLCNDDQVWMMVNGNQCNMCASYERVKAAGNGQAIQLLICLFIPVGQRLAGGKSPLEMLKALRLKFERLFVFDLEAKQPHPAIANAAFRQVVAAFPMEACPFYVFRMEGTDHGAFRVESTSQLSALMRYSNYNPIAHISCLEMSFNCNPTLSFSTKGEVVRDVKSPKRRWWKREKPCRNSGPSQPERQDDEPKPMPAKQPESLGGVNDKRKVSAQVSSHAEHDPQCEFLMEFTSLSNREAKDFASHNMGGRIKVIVGGKVPKSSVRLSDAKNAVSNSMVSIFPPEIENYRFRIDKAELDEDQHRFVVRIDAKKVSNGKKKHGEKGGLFGKNSVFSEKLRMPVIVTVIIIAIIVVGSAAGEIIGGIKEKNKGKEQETECEEYMPQMSSNFPYNTLFTGVIGSEGQLMIEADGNGYYIYDNKGTALKRTIKVKSYSATEGLVIDSYDLNDVYVGTFHGFTDDKGNYSGTFTNYKEEKVTFDLHAVF